MFGVSNALKKCKCYTLKQLALTEIWIFLNRAFSSRRTEVGGDKITKPFQTQVTCRYVAQCSPPEIWGPNSSIWGRYDFFKFLAHFQRANHDLALADIFYKIKSKKFLVVKRSPRGLRVAKKKLGLPVIKLGEMATSIFFRALLNGQNFQCCYTANFEFWP